MEKTTIERLAVLEHTVGELVSDTKEVKEDLKSLVKFVNQFKAVVGLMLAVPAFFGLVTIYLDEDKGVKNYDEKSSNISIEVSSEEYREQSG